MNKYKSVTCFCLFKNGKTGKECDYCGWVLLIKICMFLPLCSFLYSERFKWKTYKKVINWLRNVTSKPFVDCYFS